MSGYIFDYDADTRTFYVVCRLQKEKSLPDLISRIGKWNQQHGAQHHLVLPQRTVGDHWVLPIPVKSELDKQLTTNPILKRVKEANAMYRVGRRNGTFLLAEDHIEPQPRARYSPVERFLMPADRAF